MKKFQKILGISFSLVTILLLSGCAVTHSVFSAGKMKAIYESEGFEVKLIYDKDLIEDDAELFKTYQGITFTDMPDIDTVYLAEHTVKNADDKDSVPEKDGNSVLIIIFGVPGERISSDNMATLTGNGYSSGAYNVVVCRFKVTGMNATTEGQWNLESPEIIELIRPFKGATPDQTDFGLF